MNVFCRRIEIGIIYTRYKLNDLVHCPICKVKSVRDATNVSALKSNKKYTIYTDIKVLSWQRIKFVVFCMVFLFLFEQYMHAIQQRI